MRTFSFLRLWLTSCGAQLLLGTALGSATAHGPAGPRPLLDSLTRALASWQYPNVHAVLVSQRGQRAYAYYAPPYPPIACTIFARPLSR